MSDAKQKILLVEDDLGLQKQLKWSLADYELVIAADRDSAIVQLRRHEPPVVLLDLGLPPDADGATEGLAALQEILSLAPATKVIVVTGNLDRSNAVQAIQLGAYDFFQKPFEPDVLALMITRALHVHALEAENRLLVVQQGGAALKGLITSSEPMLKICRTVEKIAPANPAPARRCWRALSTSCRRAPPSALSPSTARRFPTPCWNPNCSVMKKAPSPAPPSRPSVASNTPMKARCSSMKSATCRCRCKPSCCAFCRNA